MAPRKPAATSRTPRKAPPRPAAAKREGNTKSDIPVLEWVAAALGLALTALVVGVIAWEAFDTDATPPAMRIAVQSISPAAGGYVAEIALTNEGGQPAGQVTVEGVLAASDGAPEVSEVTFDYVPDHSTRKGGLFFRADPRGRELQLRAEGFVEP